MLYPYLDELDVIDLASLTSTISASDGNTLNRRKRSTWSFSTVTFTYTLSCPSGAPAYDDQCGELYLTQDHTIFIITLKYYITSHTSQSSALLVSTLMVRHVKSAPKAPTKARQGKPIVYHAKVVKQQDSAVVAVSATVQVFYSSV